MSHCTLNAAFGEYGNFVCNGIGIFMYYASLSGIYSFTVFADYYPIQVISAALFEWR
jgi:hypothetical protein